VADGRAMMRQYDQILRAAERRFGVDRHVIAAVWGVETDYGREAGDNYLPHALATLVCEGGRRTNFWRGELIAALKLVDDGDLRLDELYGSWAGAFGLRSARSPTRPSPMRRGASACRRPAAPARRSTARSAAGKVREGPTPTPPGSSVKSFRSPAVAILRPIRDRERSSFARWDLSTPAGASGEPVEAEWG
jgi:hypothetical protein